MVIAKPEWFKRENGRLLSYITMSYLTWQGWIYLIITFSVLFIGSILPPNMVTNLMVDGVFIFLFIDMIAASYKSMDERGKMHYSISMMNMAWGMLITIIVGSIVLSYNDIKNGLSILILVAVLIGSLISFITIYKLEREN